MLSAEEILAAVPQYQAIYETIETQFPGASARERFNEGLRHLVDALVGGLIDGTVERARQSGAKDSAELRVAAHRFAGYTPETAETARALKRFLGQRVYHSDLLSEGRKESQAMIAKLFEYFVADPSRLPAPYAEQASENPPHRVVCDYIAGMTDAFFRRTYEQCGAGTLSLPGVVNPPPSLS
jgi:dGTPase